MNRASRRLGNRKRLHGAYEGSGGRTTMRIVSLVAALAGVGVLVYGFGALVHPQ
jgi:hypothetical protein